MKKCLLLILSLSSSAIFAQKNDATATSDFYNIKLTGYLQTQFQKAQSSGITSFSGGDFPESSDNRFMIRRGRLKLEKLDKYTNLFVQLDATQNGVQLLDAYIQIKEPKLKEITLTAGLFNRPFGYCNVYSSDKRSFPEMPRVFQLLLPKEKDIGAILGYKLNNALKFLTLELAVVNGSGLTSKDYDSRKDVIGNVGFEFDSLANKKLHLNFGGSIYKGAVKNPTKTFYTTQNGGYIENTSDDYIGKYLNRNYYGANLQLQYDNFFGATSFKTEFITGSQPGVAGSTDIKGPYASQSFFVQPTTSLFARNFSGYYIWLTQQIGKTGLEALISYDVYDPNTDIKDAEIGKKNTFTTAGDIKYSTLGYGMTYTFNNRLKFTLYNEQVTNESTSLTEFPNDIKDNVFTTRLQYRF